MPEVSDGSDLSELSSIASSLDQIRKRVTQLADSAVAAKREPLSTDLIAIERAVAGAVRRIERMLGSHR